MSGFRGGGFGTAGGSGGGGGGEPSGPAGGDLTGSYPNPTLAVGAVNTVEIVDLAVTSAKIADGAITTAKLAADAVTASIIATGAVGTSELAVDAVTQEKLANASVGTAEIIDANVTTAKIADANVTTAKLADLGVTTGKLNDLAVTTGKLTDLAVTTGKINDLAVTGGKLADGAVSTAKLVDGSVTTAKIAAGAVTATELATDSVTAAKIAAGAVGNSELGANVVTADKIADRAVGNTQLRTVGAQSVVGRATDTSGDAGDIWASTDGYVLRRSGTDIGFGTIIASAIGSGQVATARGGTGVDGSAAANGRLLIGNGSGYTLATLTAGTGISISNGSGSITITNSGATYTDEDAQDAVAGMLVDTATIAWTYADATPALTANVIDGSITDAKLRAGTARSVIGRSAATGGAVADIVAGADNDVLRRASGTVGFGGLSTSSITSGTLPTTRGGTGLDTSGATNGQLLIGTGSGLALATLTAGSGVSISNASGGITIGLTGAYTDEMAQDAVAAALLDTGTVDWTYDDATNTITANVPDSSITDAKLRAGSALSVVGRSANSSGNVADIAASAGSGGVLRESGSTVGFGTIATAGIADNAVTDAKLRQSGALAVLARATNSTGNVADLQATATSGAVLRESGSTIGWGTVATAGIADGAVTFAKLQAVSANVLLGNDASGTAVEEIACTAAGRALLDDADASAQRTTLGLGTAAVAASTDFAAASHTHAASAITSGELPLIRGGTGAALVDPDADRILFWDDSAGAVAWLTAGTGLSISGTTLTATGGSGTVTSVNLTAPAAGVTVSGGPVTTSGSITLALADDLAALEGVSGVGFAGRTGASAWSLLAGTQGDIPFGGASGAPSALAAGTAGQVLGTQGSGANPQWVWNSQFNAAYNGGFDFLQRQTGTESTETSYSDDTFAFDRWNVLTQTASVQCSRQAGDTRSRYAGRIKQNQASAQRAGMVQILDYDTTKRFVSQDVRAQIRVKCSSSQAIRIALIEWTGTADSPVSDPVNDWTSSTYTTGNFFKSTTTTIVAVAAVTPSAATWTALSVTGTVSSSCTNLLLMVWSEGTMAQNVTLDVTEVGIFHGTESRLWMAPDLTAEFLRCCRFFVRIAPAYGTGSFVNVAGLKVTASLHNCGTLALPVPMRSIPTSTHSSPSWAAADPSGNQLAFYNATTGGFATITGALSVSAAISDRYIGPSASAGTSFSGTTGSAGQYKFGSGFYYDLTAEL